MLRLLRARVAEWQTRKAQDLVKATSWGFKSPLSHHLTRIASSAGIRPPAKGRVAPRSGPGYAIFLALIEACCIQTENSWSHHRDIRSPVDDLTSPDKHAILPPVDRLDSVGPGLAGRSRIAGLFRTMTTGDVADASTQSGSDFRV